MCPGVQRSAHSWFLAGKWFNYRLLYEILALCKVLRYRAEVWTDPPDFVVKDGVATMHAVCFGES